MRSLIARWWHPHLLWADHASAPGTRRMQTCPASVIVVAARLLVKILQTLPFRFIVFAHVASRTLARSVEQLTLLAAIILLRLLRISRPHLCRLLATFVARWVLAVDARFMPYPVCADAKRCLWHYLLAFVILASQIARRRNFALVACVRLQLIF